MKRKIIFILALLCSVAQGAWADKWDGQSFEEPPIYYNRENPGTYFQVMIYNAAQLAYVFKHWYDSHVFKLEFFTHGLKVKKEYSEANYWLWTDIDMGDYEWIPLGRNSLTITSYKGDFNGDGHAIRFKTSSVNRENQGLFAKIASSGSVHDLNVVCDITNDE